MVAIVSTILATLRANGLLRKPFLLINGVVILLLGCSKELAPLATGDGFDLDRSQWLVVNYWAEWCGPCRHEIPELNELNAQATQQPPLVVLGVNYDGLHDEKLDAVVARMGIEFPVLENDPRARWQQALPTVLPTTFIIDASGVLQDTLVGPQTRAGILARITQQTNGADEI